jgi:hypothetical protein
VRHNSFTDAVDTKMKSAHQELSKTVPTDFIDPVEAEIGFVSDLYESCSNY